MKKIFFSILLMSFYFGGSAQDSATYAEYYGNYKFAEGSPVTEVDIVWQGGSFSISSSQGTSVMDSVGVDSFHMDYMDGMILFKRDSVTKKVSGLTIQVSGMDLEATKAEPNATGLLHRKLSDMKKDEIASL